MNTTIVDGLRMLTRGMFHAVTDGDLKQLRRTKDGPMRRQLILDWDERWPEEWRSSTDKAWKLIYVTLAFQPGPGGGRPEIGLGLGSDLFYGNSLHRAIFYVIGLVPKKWLPDITTALEALDEESYQGLFFSPWVQGRFEACCFKTTHGIDTTEDRWRTYSWSWLQKIRSLCRKAVGGGRSLVFSAENC